ncbi:unnamed protein product [Spirodela intermedia]|uniref:glucose-1-phosphate adenylyltransferase n=1 Tax=Spirodela intermedia TaxID=51605 RepID=A0A7I8JST1_SPIIN|nr:unnamed protein product [Spirodela intermedia]CAA6673236.1 unnamed protein product [Spirodela intermedia]
MNLSANAPSVNRACRRGGSVLGERSSIWGSEVHSGGSESRGLRGDSFPMSSPGYPISAAGGRRRKVRAISSVLSPDISKDTLASSNVAAIILGGGAGTKLFPLTSRRAEPAVPIGGCYRLIDIPMSNCINSGINKIYVMTQFNSWSLNRHLARTYNFGNGVNFGMDSLRYIKRTKFCSDLGTADAVRQFIWVFENIEHVLILCGDQLYRMNYMDFVQAYTRADITVSSVPMASSRASDFGLMKIDKFGRVIRFSEKPKGAELEAMVFDTAIFGLPPHEAEDASYIASMGVYAFRLDILLKLLRQFQCRWRYPTSNDFGSEIIPSAVNEYNVQAYMFHDYWEDIGTIRSFFDANLALAEQSARFQFYDPRTPFYTSPRYLPPTKMDKCKHCSIQHSIVGDRSRLEYGVQLKTEAERAALLAEGKVPIGIGRHTRIQNLPASLAAIPDVRRSVLLQGVRESDRPSEGFYVKSGIVVLLKNSTIKDGTVI